MGFNIVKKKNEDLKIKKFIYIFVVPIREREVSFFMALRGYPSRNTRVAFFYAYRFQKMITLLKKQVNYENNNFIIWTII